MRAIIFYMCSTWAPTHNFLSSFVFRGSVWYIAVSAKSHGILGIWLDGSTKIGYIYKTQNGKPIARSIERSVASIQLLAIRIRVYIEAVRELENRQTEHTQDPAIPIISHAYFEQTPPFSDE
jgi:hypothetical protein